MPQGSSFKLTDEYAQRALHVITGKLATGGHQLSAFDMAICTESATIELTALTDTRLVIFGGAQITDRFIWWNFVSSSKQRIEQAKLDWKEGRFGQIPGETGFIPLPEPR